MNYRRTEILTWLRDLSNRTHDEQLDDEQRIEMFWREGAAKFPKAERNDLIEAIAAYAVEQEAERLEIERRAATCEYMVRFFERHNIAEGLSWKEAVRAVAAQGDHEAIALLNDLDSQETAVNDALLEAAINAHPAWSRTGRIYSFDPKVGGPEDGASLIDWYQRTHPHDAFAITSRILNAT